MTAPHGVLTPRMLVTALLTATVLLAAACREKGSADVSAPLPALRVASLTLEIDRDRTNDGAGDSLWTATLRLSDAPAALRLGSITASVDFDTTRVRFLGDVTPGDQALRAVHVERGRLHLASASATGLSPDGMFQLRFVSRDTAALQAMRLDLSEAHAIDATDVRRALSIAPVRRVTPSVP